jgi:predicted dehydrogenase
MLRAGFIGFGRMGITHFSILNTHPLVKIVAVCDQSNAMLNLLGKYVDVKIYANYHEMLIETPLDFVVISTPTDSHASIIKAVAEYDLHIFTEKPFALTASEGRETLANLEGKNLVNQVGYVNRFNEIFIEVKRLLDSKTIGEIKSFSSEMYGATVLKDSKDSWRSKRKTGGGCMYEFASHCIDLVVYMLGQPDKITGSILQSIYSSNVEDLVRTTFIYNNGCNGSVIVNWSDETYRKPTNIFTIFGTKGKIVADKHSFKIYLKEEDSKNGFHKGWNSRYITDFGKSVRFYVRGNEFTQQLDYFVDCIVNLQAENVSSFAEALQTDIIMEKITRNAARLLTAEIIEPLTSSVLMREVNVPSLWRKFSNLIWR